MEEETLKKVWEDKQKTQQDEECNVKNYFKM